MKRNTKERDMDGSRCRCPDCGGDISIDQMLADGGCHDCDSVNNFNEGVFEYSTGGNGYNRPPEAELA